MYMYMYMDVKEENSCEILKFQTSSASCTDYLGICPDREHPRFHMQTILALV